MFGFVARTGVGVGKQTPGFVADRYLAALPCSAPQCHCRLEQCEFVGPGREAAESTKGVQAGEHAHQRFGGRLVGDVVEVATAEARQGGVAARYLVSGCAKQQRMQSRDRLVAHRPFVPQS